MSYTYICIYVYNIDILCIRRSASRGLKRFIMPPQRLPKGILCLGAVASRPLNVRPDGIDVPEGTVRGHYLLESIKNAS